jgi:hypothetical protein
MALVKKLARIGTSRGIVLDVSILKLMGFDDTTEIEILVAKTAGIPSVILRKHNSEPEKPEPETVISKPEDARAASILKKQKAALWRLQGEKHDLEER